MEKIININEFKKISVLKIKSKIYLVIEEKCFLELPNYILTLKEGNTLKFTVQNNQLEKIHVSFFNLLTNLKLLLANSFRRKLLLKGLGYKCTVDKETRKLSLKIGFSHPVDIFLPSDIKAVTVFKENIVIESKDKISLGNFVHKLYTIKPTNAYKEKGFILDTTKVKLKEIKKK
jgi:large subunit ribosomal protein L6